MSNDNAWVALIGLTVLVVVVATVASTAINTFRMVSEFDKDCTRWESIPEQTTNCAVNPNGFDCTVSIKTRAVCTGRETREEGE